MTTLSPTWGDRNGLEQMIDRSHLKVLVVFCVSASVLGILLIHSMLARPQRSAKSPSFGGPFFAPIHHDQYGHWIYADVGRNSLIVVATGEPHISTITITSSLPLRVQFQGAARGSVVLAIDGTPEPDSVLLVRPDGKSLIIHLMKEEGRVFLSRLGDGSPSTLDQLRMFVHEDRGRQMDRFLKDYKAPPNEFDVGDEHEK